MQWAQPLFDLWRFLCKFLRRMTQPKRPHLMEEDLKTIAGLTAKECLELAETLESRAKAIRAYAEGKEEGKPKGQNGRHGRA